MSVYLVIFSPIINTPFLARLMGLFQQSRINDKHDLDAGLWAIVREAFAAHFPRLGYAL